MWCPLYFWRESSQVPAWMRCQKKGINCIVWKPFKITLIPNFRGRKTLMSMGILSGRLFSACTLGDRAISQGLGQEPSGSSSESPAACGAWDKWGWDGWGLVPTQACSSALGGMEAQERGSTQPKSSAEESGSGGGESTPKGSGTENKGWLCLERHHTECPPSEPAPVRVGASRISSPCPPDISSEEWGCSSPRKRHSGSSPGPPQSSEDPWPWNVDCSSERTPNSSLCRSGGWPVPLPYWPRHPWQEALYSGKQSSPKPRVSSMRRAAAMGWGHNRQRRAGALSLELGGLECDDCSATREPRGLTKIMSLHLPQL